MKPVIVESTSNTDTEEFVCIFHRAFLHRTKRVCEVYCCIQSLGDPLMFHKLVSVISGYGSDIPFIWQQKSENRTSHHLNITNRATLKP